VHSGREVFEVVDHYGEIGDLGMFGGVAAAGDAYRYAVLRERCARRREDCELLPDARSRLAEILEVLHVAHAITGENGVVVRGLFRRGMPRRGGDPETIPLFDAQGRLYVAGQSGNNVLRYNGQTGTFIDEFVVAGSGGLSSPTSMTFGAGGHLYVSSGGDDSVKRYDTGGGFVGNFIAPGSGGLANPYGLAFGTDGDLFVVSQGTNSVLEYNGITGEPVGVFASGADGDNLFFMTFRNR